jgi:hypothetical protein
MSVSKIKVGNKKIINFNKLIFKNLVKMKSAFKMAKKVLKRKHIKAMIKAKITGPINIKTTDKTINLIHKKVCIIEITNLKNQKVRDIKIRDKIIIETVLTTTGDTKIRIGHNKHGETEKTKGGKREELIKINSIAQNNMPEKDNPITNLTTIIRALLMGKEEKEAIKIMKGNTITTEQIDHNARTTMIDMHKSKMIKKMQASIKDIKGIDQLEEEIIFRKTNIMIQVSGEFLGLQSTLMKKKAISH